MLNNNFLPCTLSKSCKSLHFISCPWFSRKKTSPTVSELLKQQTASTSTPTHAVNGAGDGHNVNNHTDDGYNPYEPSTIGSTIEMLLREDSESREGDSEDKKPETVSSLPTGLPDRLLQTIVDIKTVRTWL